MAIDPTEAYCQQLSLHAELLWEHELPVIASAPGFAAAQAVLDLGAGNGAFGRRLAAAYPEKRFVGVEPDAAVHAVGARSAFPANYRYVLGGYESVNGTYDLLLARHIPMSSAARAALHAWSREHVRAVLTADWDELVLEPPLPLYTAAMEHALRSLPDDVATRYAGDRDRAGTTAEWAAAGFLPSASATVAADLSDADGRRMYHHIMRLSLIGMNPEAVSRPLVDELYEWSLDPDARATISETYHSLQLSVLSQAG